MAVPITDPRVYSDFAGLDQLKRAASSKDPAALRAVAQQFESLFARMMIQSMRNAVGKDPIFGSDQEQMYQGMFDDQLSVDLTRGRGLGLADMLIRQLQRTGIAAPNAAPSASPPHTASAATRATFIRSIWSHAVDAARQLGVSAKALVAQAALETNWGRQIPAGASGASSNNLFGIKTSGAWQGSSVVASTQEYSGAAARETSAAFRAYDSPAQSFADYVALLRNDPRYAAALGTGENVQAFAAALQRGGYATDPDYARKVSAVAASLSALGPAPATGDAPAAPSAEPLKLADAQPINVTARTL